MSGRGLFKLTKFVSVCFTRGAPIQGCGNTNNQERAAIPCRCRGLSVWTWPLQADKVRERMFHSRCTNSESGNTKSQERAAIPCRSRGLSVWTWPLQADKVRERMFHSRCTNSGMWQHQKPRACCNMKYRIALAASVAGCTVFKLLKGT